MRHLYQSLGDYRFARAIQKTAGQAYVFEYVNGKDPRQVVWVAWSPTRGGREAQAALKLPGKLVKAERMPTAEKQDATVAVKQGTDGSAAVTLSESPLYLWVQE
jgi:hypothetical protein